MRRRTCAKLFLRHGSTISQYLYVLRRAYYYHCRVMSMSAARQRVFEILRHSTSIPAAVGDLAVVA